MKDSLVIGSSYSIASNRGPLGYRKNLKWNMSNLVPFKAAYPA